VVMTLFTVPMLLRLNEMIKARLSAKKSSKQRSKKQAVAKPVNAEKRI